MRRTTVLSAVYSVGQITLGLLLHPYQTMQMLVEDKVFVWMSLLPTVVLAMITLAWKWIVVPLVRLAFSCQSVSPLGCDWLSLVSNWLTFFCIFWQVMLLYLLFRFDFAFKK